MNAPEGFKVTPGMHLISIATHVPRHRGDRIRATSAMRPFSKSAIRSRHLFAAEISRRDQKKISCPTIPLIRLSKTPRRTIDLKS
jgi:hypothetical protein